MPTFVLLSHLEPTVALDPGRSLGFRETVRLQVSRECPDVRWLETYVLDESQRFLDFFEAPSRQTADRVSSIVAGVSGRRTELFAASRWTDPNAQLQERQAEAVEDASEASFPASDAPSWIGATATRDST